MRRLMSIVRCDDYNINALLQTVLFYQHQYYFYVLFILKSILTLFLCNSKSATGDFISTQSSIQTLRVIYVIKSILSV